MIAQQFGLWFNYKARQAGIKKSEHGVRKLLATLLAETVGKTHELMAIYGWKSVAQAKRYTKRADRVCLGIQASKLIYSSLNAEPNKKRCEKNKKISKIKYLN